MGRRREAIVERRARRRGEAAKMRALGMTLEAIGRKLGCSSFTVHELLKEAEAQRTPHDQAPPQGAKEK